MQEYDWPCVCQVNVPSWSAVTQPTWLLEATPGVGVGWVGERLLGPGENNNELLAPEVLATVITDVPTQDKPPNFWK